MSRQKLHDGRFRWLMPSALIFTMGVFGSHYAKFLYALVLRAFDAVALSEGINQLVSWPARGIHAGFYFLHRLLFISLPRYLLPAVAGTALMITALTLARPTRAGRALLLLSFLTITALPALYRYKPAAPSDSATHRQLCVVTYSGPPAGVTRSIQVGAELRYCDYRLLGWSEQDTVCGEERCGNRHRY